MAHATDYQSRLNPPLDMRKTSKAQALQFILANPTWTRKALTEFCMANYGPMGLKQQVLDQMLNQMEN